ncbi:MAG TPA: biotin-dependent carboxyltransferase family protein [Nitrospira sp.]|nr:biotin-dependent carboxyltransferase family protein [Nitrospira sp.]
MHDVEPAQIHVIRPGWCTTLQDLGRYGYQHYGLSPAGAMDRRSLIIANRLVGNHDGDAALEITLVGPELLFDKETILALGGADLTASINGAAAPLWTSLFVTAGSRLAFGARRAGARCYLAVAGGFDVPLQWGSRSTHLSTRTGGVQGRILSAGETLVSKYATSRHHASIGCSLPTGLHPVFERRARLRVLPAPQREAFSLDALTVLTTAPYTVTNQSDRMGYRLEGQGLTQAGTPWGISDGTVMGALQVPPDGQPILLMADRSTTGGYPKIAVVISADLPLAAQLLPDDHMMFTPTTVAEAQSALQAQWRALERILPPHGTART